jgi:hypothetical protein
LVKTGNPVLAGLRAERRMANGGAGRQWPENDNCVTGESGPKP